jgi:hypothetical protein
VKGTGLEYGSVMIKFTATKPDGGKVLFLGVSDKNVKLLVEGRPIQLIGKDVGCDHDIYVFHGATEQAMIDLLVGSGVKLPNEVKTHDDDDRQEGNPQ